MWCVYGSSVHKNTHFLLGARLQAPYSRGSPPSHSLFRNPLLSFKALQCLPTCPGLRRSVWHLSKHKAHPKDTADQAVVVDRFPQCCHTRSRLLEKGVMEMGCVQPVFSEGPMFRFNDESVALTQTTGSLILPASLEPKKTTNLSSKVNLRLLILTFSPKRKPFGGDADGAGPAPDGGNGFRKGKKMKERRT